MTSSNDLSQNTNERLRATRTGISLDWWAVILACLLALAIRFANLNIGW